MQNVKMSPPWITYVNELKAMFDRDPEIRIEYDNNTYTVKMYVENGVKADALDKILPVEKEFGNVKLNIQVIPANEPQSLAMIYRNALNGNPVFDKVKEVEVADGAKFNYVTFAKEVVQYYNDNMSDPNGLNSTLYQEIAKDLFNTEPGVFYCTNTMTICTCYED